jgi:hypothetical protein
MLYTHTIIQWILSYHVTSTNLGPSAVKRAVVSAISNIPYLPHHTAFYSAAASSNAVATIINCTEYAVKAIQPAISTPVNLLVNGSRFFTRDKALTLVECRDRVIIKAARTVGRITGASTAATQLNKASASTFKGTDQTSLCHHFHIYADLDVSEPLSFSFDSGAWLVYYQIGAAQCLKDLIDERFLSKAKFLGCGTGSVVASYMAANLDLQNLFTQLKTYSLESSSRLTGPFNLSKSLKKLMNNTQWPEMADLEGRLGISLTEVPSISTFAAMLIGSDLNLTNVLISDFANTNVYPTNTGTSL